MRKPEWLRKADSGSEALVAVKQLLRRHALNTVCEEARCPNIGECFSRGTATFMILGDICTRGCRFCSVHTGKPNMKSSEFGLEAERIAIAAKELALKHVVITSVARDDLPDGGASGFVASVAALRTALPQATIELLIPDFRGAVEPLEAVLEAAPDVLNHNIETVPRLYRRVRPGSSYRRSLELLDRAKKFSTKVKTKTGIMLGLGETAEEVRQVLQDANEIKIDIFTAGQYLQPTREHLPVEEYIHPSLFETYEAQAREEGIPEVFFGPFVRSSYHAGEFVDPAPSAVTQAVGSFS